MHLTFLANSGRIDQEEFFTKLVVVGVDGIARGTGNVRHNITLLS